MALPTVCLVGGRDRGRGYRTSAAGSASETGREIRHRGRDGTGSEGVGYIYYPYPFHRQCNNHFNWIKGGMLMTCASEVKKTYFKVEKSVFIRAF